MRGLRFPILSLLCLICPCVWGAHHWHGEVWAKQIVDGIHGTLVSKDIVKIHPKFNLHLHLPVPDGRHNRDREMVNKRECRPSMRGDIAEFSNIPLSLIIEMIIFPRVIPPARIDDWIKDGRISRVFYQRKKHYATLLGADFEVVVAFTPHSLKIFEVGIGNALCFTDFTGSGIGDDSSVGASSSLFRPGLSVDSGLSGKQGGSHGSDHSAGTQHPSSNANPKGSGRPINGFFSSVRRLPLGTQVGIAIFLSGCAGLIQFGCAVGLYYSPIRWYAWIGGIISSFLLMLAPAALFWI